MALRMGSVDRVRCSSELVIRALLALHNPEGNLPAHLRFHHFLADGLGTLLDLVLRFFGHGIPCCFAHAFHAGHSDFVAWPRSVVGG